MLFVYSRHTPDCAHKDELKYRRCRCPKWIDGYVDGERVRQSAKTRSWEQAERKARLLEGASDPANLVQPKVSTIAEAYPRKRLNSRRLSSKSNYSLGQSTAA